MQRIESPFFLSHSDFSDFQNIGPVIASSRVQQEMNMVEVLAALRKDRDNLEDAIHHLEKLNESREKRAATDDSPPKRGRPLGSKNRPKANRDPQTGA